jgi:hypothetical protein
MTNSEFDRNVIEMARTRALAELARRVTVRSSRVATFEAAAAAHEGLLSLPGCCKNLPARTRSGRLF